MRRSHRRRIASESASLAFGFHPLCEFSCDGGLCAVAQAARCKGSRHNVANMVRHAQIVELSRRIARHFAPETIVLFGSRAHGRARRELRARKRPNLDAVRFHARQRAEKYLKALLQKQRQPIPRTHNLEALAKPLLAAHVALGTLSQASRTLGACARETRYPGKSADRALAGEAPELRARIRPVCRKALKARR